MLKIGIYETENFGHYLSQNNASITFYEWDKSVEDLIDIFKNNNCVFTIDNITYKEYGEIISASKNMSDGSYSILLNNTMTDSDVINDFFGDNLSRLEIKEKKSEIEELSKTFDDEQALNFLWMLPSYTPGTFYHINDRVKNDGNLYKCIQEHIAPDTLVEEYWWNVNKFSEGE